MKKTGFFTSAKTAIAAGMLVTPPAIIKPIAAPGAIPKSTNPPTVGIAANPLRYAGIPSNTELGIAHHAVPPR